MLLHGSNIELVECCWKQRLLPTTWAVNRGSREKAFLGWFPFAQPDKLAPVPTSMEMHRVLEHHLKTVPDHCNDSCTFHPLRWNLTGVLVCANFL